MSSRARSRSRARKANDSNGPVVLGTGDGEGDASSLGSEGSGSDSGQVSFGMKKGIAPKDKPVRKNREHTLFWTSLAISAAWLHGATVGIAMGNSILHRLFLFTLMFVGPVVALWRSTESLALKRLAASIVYFLCAMQATAWSLSWAWYRNPHKVSTLPDLGHDLLGARWDFNYSTNLLGVQIHFDADMIPDVFMVGSIIAALTFILKHPLRWIILRRVFFVHATLMLFRCFTILSTSLPDSHPRCKGVTPRGDLPNGAASIEFMAGNFRDLVIRSLQVMVPIGEITCGDMVFSGHSMLLVLTALVFHTYYPRTVSNINGLKFLVWTWTFIGLVSIIATHLHYTLDVILAWYLTVTVWSSYHRIANDVIKGRRFEMVWMLDICLIYPAIEYFEAGVGIEGVCTGIHARTIEEINRYPMASPTLELTPQAQTPTPTVDDRDKQQDNAKIHE